MGMQPDGPASTPDTFGLHEDFVTDIQTEIIGGNVRLIIGTSRCGQIHWIRTTVIPAERAMILARIVAEAAQEALNLVQLMAGLTAH